jgi:hypothetical protein
MADTQPDPGRRLASDAAEAPVAIVEPVGWSLRALTGRAQAGGLSPTDVQHGTFSISNHGVSGSLVAAPIVSAGAGGGCPLTTPPNPLLPSAKEKDPRPWPARSGSPFLLDPSGSAAVA